MSEDAPLNPSGIRGSHGETTASMLSLGVVALLRPRDQPAALRAGEHLVPGAVEQLLRHLTFVHIGLQGQLVTAQPPTAQRQFDRDSDLIHRVI
ncbi:hypothetical protein [Streptomyces sp. NRRL S-646]|uniref:hypothetical protein n=1 Tax=Streptomyces sp. NRRL S-646 TaxID=1463917 RepID=UPI0004CBCB03